MEQRNVIGAPGSIPHDLECYLEKIGISCNIGTLQKSILLGNVNYPLNNKIRKKL